MKKLGRLIMGEGRPGFLHEQIYRDLLEAIRTKKLAVGDRLPSEAELAQQYGVSRITSKKALNNLCDKGYVERRPGRGTFLVADDEMLPDPEEKTGAVVWHPRRKLVGLVMERVSSGFGGDLLLGIEQKLSALGYDLVVKFSYSDPDLERKAIEQLQAAGVLGIIIMCVYNEIYNPLLLRMYTDAFPLVIIDRELKGLSIPFVGTDNRVAARELANELFQRGHKKIAFISVEGSLVGSTVQNRLQGMIESFTAHHQDFRREEALLTIPRDFLTDDTEFSEKNQKIVCQFLKEHPEVTGLLAASYYLTNQATYAVTYLGREVEIAGFDRPAPVKRDRSSLYVVQDQHKIGETAVEYIDCLIERKGTPPRTTYVDYLLMGK